MTDTPKMTYAEVEASLSHLLNTFTLAVSTAPTREGKEAQHEEVLRTVEWYVSEGIIPPQRAITATTKDLPTYIPRGVDPATLWPKVGTPGLQLDLWVYSTLFGAVCPGDGGNLSFSRYLSDPVLSCVAHRLPHEALEAEKQAWMAGRV